MSGRSGPWTGAFRPKGERDRLPAWLAFTQEEQGDGNREGDHERADVERVGVAVGERLPQRGAGRRVAGGRGGDGWKKGHAPGAPRLGGRGGDARHENRVVLLGAGGGGGGGRGGNHPPPGGGGGRRE